jgi:SAM-dependent methyltransferase
MREIPDASADLVLFSFNGIDYVPPEQRLQILRECRRICRHGAFFALSTHNLDMVPREFARKPGLKGLSRWLLTRLLNFPLGAKLKRDHAVLNDGVHRFGLRTHYIKPRAMIQQLSDAGFRSPRVFHTGSGAECFGEDVSCPFPYFLCIAD